MDQFAPASATSQAVRELAGKKVTVMGLGSFGGGVGVVGFLVRHGAHVTVTDIRTENDLQGALAMIVDSPPDLFRLGGHDERDFVDADLVVVNPAVPKTNRFVQRAIQAGVPLTSEMNLFWKFNPAPVVAVTGSNGKSTTTAMIHAILSASGRKCWLGGNIGRSLLPEISQIQKSDLVVLELSSFQLEDLDRLRSSPHCAIVTNFTANHLDRHETLENYRAAKQAILRWQNSLDHSILNQDDTDVASWPTRGHRLYFGLTDQGRDGVFLQGKQAVLRRAQTEWQLPLPDCLKLPGRHNLQNALAATCAAICLNTSNEAVQEGLRNYRALPHRLELVAEGKGRQFYNDSLATTPESAMVALEAFSESIILLAGGYDKGSDLSMMARAIAEKPVMAVALMGTTGPRIGELITNWDPTRRVRQRHCSDFRDAFQWSVAQSTPGTVIVLSPGCASYDWFKNFQDRGDQFRAMATEWVQA